MAISVNNPCFKGCKITKKQAIKAKSMGWMKEKKNNL